MFIVIDTNVFIRTGKNMAYEFIKDKIKDREDIILITNEIIKEYKGASRRPLYIIYLIENYKKNKSIKTIPASKVEEKIKLLKEKRKKMPLPEHKPDVRFVDLAWSQRAGCVLSKNHHLTDLHPYSFEGIEFDIFGPESY